MTVPIENGTIHLFPIERVEDYSLVTQSYTSNETRGLMYTLGALYSFIGFCCLITLVLYLIVFTRLSDGVYFLGVIFSCFLPSTVKEAIENQISRSFHINIPYIVCLPSDVHVFVSDW